MKHLLWPAALALASMTLFACKSMPFMGPGCLVLTVRGLELDDVASIYLIVGAEADLADLESKNTINRVVLPDRQKKYITFGQFTAKFENRWRLQPLLLKTDAEMVEVEVLEDDPNQLRVEIHRELLESHGTLAAVVVVNCKTEGWGACEVITSSQIRNIDDMELDLRGATISVHDKSSGSIPLPVAVPK